MSLLSYADNYACMNIKTPLAQNVECVQVANPKTKEFEIVRTSLLPGLLKTLRENKEQPLPQKIFEISDCVVLDEQTETGAQNVRKIAALTLDHSSNFEVIHGLLDLVMLKCNAEMGKDYKLV